MGNLSYFESRSAKLTCTPEKVFNFVTDIRNFEQFIPSEAVSNWQADSDSCSFNVSSIGSVNLKLVQKEKFNLVAFKGDALRKNEFDLELHINRKSNDLAEVKVSVNAELNPIMKMIAARPIGQFLEMLIDRMEKFDGWEKTKE
jgi:carbon monoxide dehydrogenase subunit G